MRVLYIILALSSISSCTFAQSYTFGSSPSFSTDFRRVAGIDDSLFFNFWEVYTPDDPHGDSTVFTSSNIQFSESDGLLLKVTPPTRSSKGKPFGAGIKSSRRYLYGRYVISARVPRTTDPHASAWLVGGGPDAALNGYREVDIFEHAHFSGGQESVQIGAFVAKNGSDRASHILSRKVPLHSSNEFHTFRVDWTPKDIRFFIDNMQVGKVSTATKAGDKQPLKHDMRIRLDICNGIQKGASWQALRIRHVSVYPLVTRP